MKFLVDKSSPHSFLEDIKSGDSYCLIRYILFSYGLRYKRNARDK